MKLPGLFSKKKDTKKYLVILISDYAVRTALVEVADTGVAVLSQSNTQQYTDKQALIANTDAALQELSSASEHVEEVIFALEANWVNETGIIDVKKPLLKDLTTQLSLKAVGFVVIPEAIVQAYGEGQVVSSLLIQVTKEKVGLYLVQQGIIQKAETVGRSHEHTGDVFEGIARITQGLKGSTTLPSTIVITSFEVTNEELETMRQELMQVDWQAQQDFLQQPVIDIIPPEQITDMVAIKGGEAVARAQGLVIGSDNQASAHVAPPTEMTPTSFGIPIASESTLNPPDAEEVELEEQAVASDVAQQKRKKLIKLISIGVVLGLIVVSIIIFFVIRTTASVQVSITPKLETVAKELEVTIDSSAEASDPEALILAGKTITTTVEDEDALTTTGRKVVGDPAKGTITIFNKTSSEKVFAKGTELRSGELTFTTDSEITVPAAEVTEQTEGSTSKFGKANIAITASEIGEEGNIKKEAKLSVASFAANTYEGIVVSDFGGGSSREVRVISEDDRKNVLANLTKELLKKGQDQLQTQATAGQYVLPTQSITITAAEYSGEVGKEANEVSVSATATVKAVSYSSEDLRPLATKALESEIPAGYALLDEDPQVLSAPAEDEEASGSAQLLSLNISSRARPQFDESGIESLIVGKSFADANQALQQNQQIQSFQLQFMPSIAQAFGATVPKNAEKIKVEFK